MIYIRTSRDDDKTGTGARVLALPMNNLPRGGSRYKDISETLNFFTIFGRIGATPLSLFVVSNGEIFKARYNIRSFEGRTTSRKENFERWFRPIRLLPRSTRPGEIDRFAAVKKKKKKRKRRARAPLAGFQQTAPLPPSLPRDPKPRPVIKHSSSLLDEEDSRASFYIKHVHY